MSNIFIHSKGLNWHHFRDKEHPNSIYGSFTITDLSDGRRVITGDYGTLVWDVMDRGIFPNKMTNIGYFSEKVMICCSTFNPKIKAFTKEKCLLDIKEDFLGQYDNVKEWINNRKENHLGETRLGHGEQWDLREKERNVEKVIDLLGFNSCETQQDFYENINDDELNIYDAFCECEYGTDYTSQFKFVFKLLKEAMELIRKEEEVKS